MIDTLATVISHSLTGLSWLSPIEVFAVVAAIAYGVGGLVALRMLERRPTAPAHPAASRQTIFQSAA